MAKVATKKSVGNSLGNYFEVKRKDITYVADFGRFEVVVCKGGVIFRTHLGFMLWCTPWVVAMDGSSGRSSLYEWLTNLAAMKKECEGKETLPYPGMDDSSITYADMLDSMVMITESNLTHPTVAFVDLDEASRFAKQYINWLISKTKELDAAMSAPVADESEEDLRRNFEHGQAAVMAEVAAAALKESAEAVEGA